MKILLNCFTAKVDNLLINESIRIRRKICCFQFFQAAINCFQIFWPHVFGRIDTKTGNTVVNQPIQEFQNFVADVWRSLIQIRQTGQLTIAHFVRVCAVTLAVNRTALMEIVWAVWNVWIQSLCYVGRAIASANDLAQLRCHMVWNDIDIDTNADPIATLDHISEFKFIAWPRYHAIRYGLIAFPPRSIFDYCIFTDRWHLDAGETIWCQKHFTFRCDITKFPFEQMNHDRTIWLIMRIVMTVRHREPRANENNENQANHFCQRSHEQQTKHCTQRISFSCFYRRWENDANTHS